ncbi:hypothetical protein A3D02_03680 [Candidatus Daviesbacteria bacterium RIFCSPHIGHO2_02_FULL_39_41]|nr:MAG: hypothetical protein A3D02_03680 [Candidatus Daviesbacteria bacterium RIFCSPHIGHO2_02_FULL_39_41]
MPDVAVKISTALIITLTSNPFLPRSYEVMLSSHEISLENRYPVKSVSDVFKDNILLNLSYMEGKVSSKAQINWDEIRKPFVYQFRLEPNQAFAFHDDILPEYKDKVVKTTNAHFNSQEGFKTDGYLFGDGVCHLASLIYWVALDAGLEAKAPVNHNFMPIPEIAKEYGVSIYSNPYSKGANSRQNLYITNNKEKPVEFKFEYKDDKLKVSVLEEN